MSDQTVLMAVDDPLVPLYRSFDRGKSWTAVEALRGLSAVALDPENPGWIAVALHQATRDMGLVRVSADGGLSWQTVLITGNQGNGGVPADLADDTPRAKIRQLIVNVDHNCEIVAVTLGGLYKVVLAGQDVHH